MATSTQPGRANMWFILGLIGTLGLLSFLVLRPFLSYVAMGLFLAYASYPLYRRLVRWTGEHSRIAGILTVILLFVIVIVPVVYVSFALLQDVTSLARSLTPSQVEAFVSLILERAYALAGEPPPEPGFATELVTQVVPTLQAYLTARIPGILTFFGSFLVGLFVMGFVMFYALVDGERLLGYVRSVIPLTTRQADLFFKKVGATVDAAFLGQIVVSVLQGVVGGLGFYLFGVPNPFFWGFVMIILSIIPLVGAFLVWAPAGLLLWLLGDTFNGFAILLWGLVPVSLVDNVVRPYLVGAQAEMHPVLVLVGVLGGLLVFGFVGFIIGPLVLSLFVAALNFWRDDYVKGGTVRAVPASIEAAGGPADAPADADD